MFKVQKKTSFAWLICLFLISISSLSADPRLLTDLRVLLEQVTPSNTAYVHGRPRVVWQGEHGAAAAVCFTDCSGLIDALLRHSYGYTPADLHRWTGKRRPKARDYYRMIKENSHFQRIFRIADVQPGDILAIWYPPGAPDPGHDTGHVAVIDAVPDAMQAKRPFISNTRQWKLTVIDSSGGHGIDDTRYLGNGKHRRGLGKGAMRLYTDQEGNLVGYTWSLGNESVYHPNDERPLAIGRFLP